MSAQFDTCDKKIRTAISASTAREEDNLVASGATRVEVKASLDLHTRLSLLERKENEGHVRGC
jgi:hypothetical protein